MGSSSWTIETILLWWLDRRLIPDPYQFSRNNGHSFSTEGSHTPHTPFLCYDIHRQYNSGLVYQQTRRNAFPQPMHRRMGNPPFVPGTHYPQKWSYPRQIQHSGKSSLNTEWSLYQTVANCVFQILNFPIMDLFTTRLSHKLPLYVSLVLDNQAFAIDTLSMNWNNLHDQQFWYHLF